MSIDATLARIAQLQATFIPVAPAGPPRVTGAPATGAVAGAPATATASSFATTLQYAGAAAAPGAVPVGGTGAGAALLTAARAELGVAEQPPGSNDSPRIAQFRQATAGSGVGPWCAYFVSWAARQAGTPLGDSGQGFGRVDDVWAWAERAGKAVPAGSPPAPGDLIVWDEHIGVVSAVDPDGTVHTVEGNSSDRVSERTYGPDGGGAVGYVRLG